MTGGKDREPILIRFGDVIKLSPSNVWGEDTNYVILDPGKRLYFETGLIIPSEGMGSILSGIGLAPDSSLEHVTGHWDLNQVIEAQRNGFAAAFQDRIPLGFQEAMEQKMVIASRSLPRRLLEVVGHSLTPRQVEVIKLVAQGKVNKQIAEELNIRPATVNAYLDQISARLGVHGRSKTVFTCIEYGIIDVNDIP